MPYGLEFLGPALSGGTKIAGGLAGLLNGNPAALPSSILSLIPTAMSGVGSALGGSASAGLSSLAAGVAPTLASALSLYAGPLAVAAYAGSKKLTEQLQAPKAQGADQIKEYQGAMTALPGRLKARTAGAAQLSGLADLSSPEALQAALQASHAGIQGDLSKNPLWKTLEMAVNGPDRMARKEFGASGGDAAWAPVRDKMTGEMGTDNYMAQLALTDTAGRQGVDTAPYQTWKEHGGNAGGQFVRDNNGTVTGWQDAEGAVSQSTPGIDKDWTWDEDFLNNAVATLGGAYGIDPSKLPGAEVAQEGLGMLRDSAGSQMAAPTTTLKLTAADLPGWEAGNYTQAITNYLKGLDPNIEQDEDFKRYQGMSGLASLLGGA
jgi:hypothetical protein